MNTMKLRLAVAAGVMAFLLVPAARDAAAGDDYFWRLGVGTYGTPGPKTPEDEVLTHARFDWQMIAFGNSVDMPTINRCLAMNPRQRFLVRLWPKQGGDNFLTYLYKPGVRERIHQAVADQVNKVLSEITRPDQVLAFTFLEELPDHWHPFWSAKDDAAALAFLEPYRAAIEKDLGGPLVYDDAQKAWMWRKFAESLDGIHGAIRAAAGPDRLVIYWARYYGTPEDVLKKLVHPGGADGPFFYVLRPDQWARQVAMAETNRWPFFSQLSLNTLMKQADWQSCVELPHVKSRYNLGYFFYTSGNPLRPHFFDCQAIDPVNNVSRLSNPVHLRWFAADRNLGWDVFKRNIHFAPLIDFRPEGSAPGDVVDLYALIPNPILEGHYPDEPSRRIQRVTAKLKLPAWLKLESGGARLKLGDLGPSRHRAPAPGSAVVAHWRVKVVGHPSGSSAKPITVSIAGRHPTLGTIRGRTEIDGRRNHVLSALAEQPLLVSGQGWVESGFGLKQDARPTIMMRTGARAVSKPSLTDDDPAVEVSLGSYANNAGFYRLRPVDPTNGTMNRLVFDGEIPPHSTLAILPDGRATLAPTRPLFEKRFTDQQSAGPGVSFGYYLGAHGIGRPIPSGEKVAVTMTGKKEGAVNSLVLVYFRNADTGERTSRSDGLVNRFGTDWTSVRAELPPPYTNAILESIALYRFPGNATGAIWYGTIEADLVTGPSAARDVSASVRGVTPLLRAGHVNAITYFDEDTHQPEGNKISVRLSSGAMP